MSRSMDGRSNVFIVVALGVAAALGFFVQRTLTRPQLVASPAAPAASSAQAAIDAASNATAAAQAPSEAPPQALRVPDVLPQFELADRDGKLRKLGEWTGRPVAVNFWATWCGPCRREIPLLNKLRRDRAGQKLEIIGIAVDFRDDVLKYAKATTISYPLLIGEDEGLAAVKAMGMQPQFPFTAFADSKQRIVALKVGELHQEDADLILDRVADVDAGRLDMAAARLQITEGLKTLADKRAATNKG
ncbi:MAG: TlpA disulfide reductase family protein [Pseudomonadota bacterium]